MGRSEIGIYTPRRCSTIAAFTRKGWNMITAEHRRLAYSFRILRRVSFLLATLVAPAVCLAGLGLRPPACGTAITVRPCTSSEHPPQTNAIPFQESFESYSNTASINSLDGWSSDITTDISIVTNASLPGTIVAFPIATNHTRYAMLNTQGSDLINVITGSQQHVWVDMLTAFVPSDTDPYTNGVPRQVTLYSNYRSNLCACARPPNTNKAVFVESACRMEFAGMQTFYRLSVHLAYLPPPTGGCFAVYVNGAAVNWPGGETLPGVPADSGQGPWLRCVPGSGSNFPGLAFTGTGYVDDLVVAEHEVLPGSSFTAGIDGAAAINWPADFGRRYQVDACTNLLSSDWQPLGDVVIGNGSTNYFTDADGLPTRFYRVRDLDP